MSRVLPNRAGNEKDERLVPPNCGGGKPPGVNTMFAVSRPLTESNSDRKTSSAATGHGEKRRRGSIVPEFVVLVDAPAGFVRRVLAAAERARDIGIAAGVRVAPC